MPRPLLALAAILLVHAALPERVSAAPLPPIRVNDNRLPAGRLRGGVLTIQLEIGEGEWHPGAESATGLPVYAFGDGGALQVPGPLLRVPLGTTIAAAVHNALALPAIVHGLRARAREGADAFTLAPGETRQVTFVADAVGTFYYWAATSDVLLDERAAVDVLEPGQTFDPATDKIIVFSMGHVAPYPLMLLINGQPSPRPSS